MWTEGVQGFDTQPYITNITYIAMIYLFMAGYNLYLVSLKIHSYIAVVIGGLTLQTYPTEITGVN